MIFFLYVFAALAGSEGLDAALVAAERAWIRGEEATLDRIAAELESEGEGGVDWRHALAYVHWRRASFHERGSRPSKSRLEQAEELLESLLDDDPDHAEALALFGTVNGGLITSMWSGMRRGPRADKAYEKARELAPENPRVAMHQGVSRLFRPSMFGGGADKALEELEAALVLFDAQPPGIPRSQWGRAELLGWLGVTRLRLKDFSGAREHYRRALELEPEFYWIRETLLPELAAAEREH